MLDSQSFMVTAGVALDAVVSHPVSDEKIEAAAVLAGPSYTIYPSGVPSGPSCR